MPGWLCQDFPLHRVRRFPDRPYQLGIPPLLRRPFAIERGLLLSGGIAARATGLGCLPLLRLVFEGRGGKSILESEPETQLVVANFETTRGYSIGWGRRGQQIAQIPWPTRTVA